MSEESKSDYWIITHTEQVMSKVCFEQPLTKFEAEDAFHDGEYADILDTETLNTISVDKLEIGG